MATRRFQDDMADSTPPAKPAGPARPTRSAPNAQQPQQRPATSRNMSHLPRTLAQVLNEANDLVVRGDLSDYVPLPTGFDPLDGMIGGGLRKTELVLMGGAQGIGKTIAALQIARNIAMHPDQFAFYLSYEH